MVLFIILPPPFSGSGPWLKSPVSNAFWVENYRAKEKKEKKKKGKSVILRKYVPQFYTQIP